MAMANNIIDFDKGIVAKETQVKLSDEKLKSMLSKVYERAVGDMGKKRIRKMHSPLLAISGTLLVALLTSDFRSIGGIDGGIVTIFAWVLCFVCCAAGVIMLAYSAARGTTIDLSARDEAVEDVFNHHIS